MIAARRRPGLGVEAPRSGRPPVLPTVRARAGTPPAQARPPPRPPKALPHWTADAAVDGVLHVGGERAQIRIGELAEQIVRQRQDLLFRGESGQPLLRREPLQPLLRREPLQPLLGREADHARLGGSSSRIFWNTSS